MRLRTIVMMVLALFAAQARTDGDPASQLRNARSLKCHFGSGTATQWTGSKPKVSNAQNDQDVQFDSINLKNGTARLIGNVGAADIKALPTQIGISFIESTPAVFDTTTVLAVIGEDKEFLAVDSRHVLLLGTPLAEQYFGTCRILQ